MAPKADAPKKTATKSKSSPPKHAPFLDMIKDAILNLKERNGSSRQAIKKYIQANNNLGGLSDSSFNNHISRALSTGEENGVFERPKGPSGPVKLKKASAKPAEKKESKPAKSSTTTKKASTTKSSSTTKKPAATKKTTAAKKSTTAKPKANASKPRAKKDAAAPSAPAVGEEKSVVLGKTKSGRVTKSKAPQASKPAAKKAGAGAKKPAAKKATPKKSTPKKAEAAA